MQIVLCILIGVTAGFFSGLLGIGGGTILIPALIFLLGFGQHMAQGTALAIMLPPVLVLAVLKYYSQGQVNVGVAVIVALGLIVGAFFGAGLAQKVQAADLKRLFGIYLIIVGAKMFFFK